MGKLSKLSLGLFNKDLSLADISLEEENIEKSLKKCARFITNRKEKGQTLILELEKLIQTKESLQKSLEDINPLLKDLEENYLSLCERKELEEKKSALLSKQKNTAQDKIAVYKKETQKLQKQIAAIQKESEDLEAKITILKSVEKDERAKHTYFDKRQREIEKRHHDLKAQKEKLWKESEGLKAHYEKLQKELEKLQDEISHMAKDKLDLETALESIKFHIKDSEHKTFEHEQKYNELNEETALLKKNYTQKSNEYKILKDAFLKLEEDINHLSITKEEFLSSLSNLDIDTAKLTKELHAKKIDQDIIYNELNELSEKLSLMKTEHKTVISEIESMKQKIISYSQQKIELNNQIEDYRRFLLEAYDLKESWKIKFKREEKKFNEILQKHNEEKERFDLVNNDYLRAKKETETLKRKYLETHEMISHYQNDRQEMIQKTNVTKKSIISLKNKIKETAKKREENYILYRQAEDRLIQVVSKKSEYQNALKKELLKKEAIENKQNNCEKMILTERKNIDFLKDEIQKVETEIFDIQKKIDNLDKKIATEELERSRIRNVLNQTKTKLSNTLELRLQREKIYEQAILATNEVKTNVDAVNNEINKHENKVKELVDETKNLKNNILKLNKDYNSKRSQSIKLKARLKEISEEISLLRGEKKLKKESSIVLTKEISEYKNKILSAKIKLKELSQVEDTGSSEHTKLAAEYERLQKIYQDWNEKIELKTKEINVIDMRDRDYMEKTNELQVAIDAKRRELSRLEEKLKYKRKNASDHAYLVSSLSQALNDIDSRIVIAKEEILDVKEVSSLYFSQEDESQWRAFKKENARLSLAEETFAKLINEVQDQEFDDLNITHTLEDKGTLAGKLVLKNLATRAEELKVLVRPYALVLKEEGISLRLKTQVDKNRVCRSMTIEWEKEATSSESLATQIN